MTKTGTSEVELKDINKKSTRGAVFSILSKFCNILLTLGLQAVFGRWLDPADYGVYAMSLTALNFLLLFREFGLQAAGIQKAVLEQAEASFLFWANIAIVIVITIIALLVAPFVASFYSEPRLTVLLQAMAVAAALGGISAQHNMVLRRRMQFSKVAAAEITALVVATVVGLTVGYYIRDMRALLAVYIAQQLTLSCATIILSGWSPSLPHKIKFSGEMLSFGVGVTLANIIYFITNNISTVLIGYSQRDAALGHFNRAQQLYMVPGSVMSTSIYLVVFGSLSRLMKDPDLYSAFYKTTLMRTSAVFYSLAGFLMVCGSDAVRVLLGPNWDTAGLLLQIMSFGLIGTGSAQMSGILFQSQGRLREFQIWGVIDGGIRIGSILVGANFGIVGITIAYSCSTTLVTAPVSLWVVGRKGPVTLSDQLYSLSSSIVFIFAAFAGSAAGKYLSASQGPILILVIEGVFCACFVVVMGLIFPRSRRMLLELTSNLRSSFRG